MSDILLSDVKDWIVALAAVIGGVMYLKATLAKGINDHIHEELKPAITEALKPLGSVASGTNALLAFRLERESDRAIKRNYISESGREAIIKMRKPYLDSGQNGFINDKCERALRVETLSNAEFETRIELDCFYLESINTEEEPKNES